MRIIRFAIIGAAVAAGIGYMIKKNEEGESILDDFTDHFPDLLDKAKDFGVKTFQKFVADIKQ
ncbi:YtxH domain-containing protein [Mucilaginibacter sp.]